MEVIINQLVRMGVLERAPFRPSFVSQIFLIPKGDASMRPIFNLKSLNNYVFVDKFRLINVHKKVSFLQPGDWLAKIDLSNAYFHLPVSEAHRCFLRVIYKGHLWQMTPTFRPSMYTENFRISNELGGTSSSEGRHSNCGVLRRLSISLSGSAAPKPTGSGCSKHSTETRLANKLPKVGPSITNQCTISGNCLGYSCKSKKSTEKEVQGSPNKDFDIVTKKKGQSKRYSKLSGGLVCQFSSA